MKTIVVHIAEKKWTLEALHLACALARNQKTNVTLLRLMHSQHIQWLGTEAGSTQPSPAEYEDLKEFVATAEDYGVEITLCNMQYETLSNALAEAAEYVEADALFAQLPKSALPFWRKFQLWQLKSRLAEKKCELFTLDPTADSVQIVPAVVVRAAK